MTDAPRPVPLARPGIVLEPPGLKTIFEDSSDFVNQLMHGPATATLETKDKYSGSACIKIAGGSRPVPSALPGDSASAASRDAASFAICSLPGRKPAVRPSACSWPTTANSGRISRRAARFDMTRGRAGRGRTESLEVSHKLPAEWVLVTRDLFADFGELR